MATLDKQSLREEARRIQLEFERLAESSKIDNDVKMLFHSMFMLINLLVAIFLEKTTKKTNKNSGKPSSQTQKDDSALDMTGSKSKGNAENLLMATNSRTLESTTVICVDACDHCDESLANTTCCCIERRTKIDIPFEKHVEHFDAEVKECPSCHAKVKGTFPDENYARELMQLFASHYALGCRQSCARGLPSRSSLESCSVAHPSASRS